MSWDIKKLRYTEEQIAFALKQAETGHAGRGGHPPDWCFRASLLLLKKVCSGLSVGEPRQAKQLKNDNRKLRQLVANLNSASTS